MQPTALLASQGLPRTETMCGLLINNLAVAFTKLISRNFVKILESPSRPRRANFADAAHRLSQWGRFRRPQEARTYIVRPAGMHRGGHTRACVAAGDLERTLEIDVAQNNTVWLASGQGHKICGQIGSQKEHKLFPGVHL